MMEAAKKKANVQVVQVAAHKEPEKASEPADTPTSIGEPVKPKKPVAIGAPVKPEQPVV